MKFTKFVLNLFLLFLLFLLPKANSAFAEEYWDLGAVDPNHDFVIQFNQEVDYNTINQIFILNDQNERLPYNFKNSDNTNSVIIEAPSNGYKVNESYSIHITKKVKSVNGDDLKEGIVAEFSIISSKVSGTVVGISQNGQTMYVEKTDGTIAELLFEEHAHYSYVTDKGNTSVSEDNFKELLTHTDAASVTYEVQNGMPHYVVQLNQFTGKFDAFSAVNNEITDINLFIGETEYLLEFPVTEEAQYQLQLEGETIYLSKADFIELLSYADAASVTYEVQNGMPHYVVELNQFTGKFDAFSAVNNEITDINLFIGETEYLLEFPVTEEAQYELRLEGETIYLSKADFIELLSYADAASVTYEVQNGMPHYVVELNQFTGKFDAFSARNNEITDINLFIGETEYLLEFPVTEEAQYQLQLDGETIDLSKADFIELLSYADAASVTYECNSGIIVYTIVSS